MVSRSAGSNVSASPGSPSVTRLTHRICNGNNGNGMPKKGVSSMTQISPELEVIVYLMNLRMLS